MSPPLLIPIIGSLASYLLFRLAEALYVELTSPLRDLPGPNGGSLLYGHFSQVEVREPPISMFGLTLFSLQKDMDITHKWCQEFGRNFQVRGLLNVRDSSILFNKVLN